MEKKKVLLIGDSIRCGYDNYVKKALADTCEVVYPGENCQFAQYVLRHLSTWKECMKLDDDLDLVHWNAGLWDTLVLYKDECLTPPDFYAYFIEKICKRIQVLFPKAKVIFATSTPIIEHRFTENSYRLNSDVKKYNKIAVEICKKYGFIINDLYSVLDGAPENYYIDCTHPYTVDGTTLTTNAVVKSVSEALELEYKEYVPDEKDIQCIEKRIKNILGI